MFSVLSWTFLKNRKLEKITNKLCGIFQKDQTLGGQLNVVFGAKQTNIFGPPETPGKHMRDDDFWYSPQKKIDAP